MAYRVRTVRDNEEHARAVGSISHYFGREPTAEDAERFSRILPHERLHAVFDGTRIVAGAGAYPFELTIPGGPVRCAGISVVGVLPTHRRRGLLQRMMTTQLADVRERGEPIAALWASEETIYGRYGYGMASLNMGVKLAKVWASLRADVPAPTAEARLVDHDEAMRVFPRVYDRVRRAVPGFVSRSPAWWEVRSLDDQPDRRRGGGSLNRVLFERDGCPVGFALYRMVQEWTAFKTTLRVIEAFGVDDAATRDVVRFLLAIDWVDDITWRLLPVDHPVKLLVSRVSELGLSVGDGLWTRLVDVGAALNARSYSSDGRVTFEVVSDPVFADNVDSWTVADGRAKRSSRRPDVRLDVQALGAAFLGGFSFVELARAGRVEEAARGGLARADALFRTDRAPWCPEIF
jgi:predicted acetyltransferase